MADRPEPVTVEGEVLLEVSHVGLCGTDLHIGAGEHPRARSPLVLGHEVVGRARTGEHAGRMVLLNPLLPCGGCVSCRSDAQHACSKLRLVGIDVDGGLAERISVAGSALHPVPFELPGEIAVMGEPLAVGVHALRRGRLVAGERTVVAGAGPVGLLVALLARREGADVIMLERSPQRVEAARGLGFETLDADDPVAALAEWTDGDLVDVVFDAAGSPPMAALVTRLLRPRGRLVVIASYGPPPEFDLQAVTFGELEVLGTRVYSDEDIATALALLPMFSAELGSLLSRPVALEGVESALDDLRAGRALKMVAALRGAA